MRKSILLVLGIFSMMYLLALLPKAQAEPTWEAKHIYIGQWLYFDIGTLDQGTEIDYGIRVTTADESVNVAFMDSTNYAAYSQSPDESFVGWDVQYQVRTREATTKIPYQQQWYFVAESDSGYEIDIEYYVSVVDDSVDFGACCGGFFIGIIALMGVTYLISYVRK